MESRQQEVFDRLKDKGPEVWRDYLSSSERNTEVFPELSMLTIFDRAAVRARRERSLPWAEVAVEAMEIYARRHSGGGRGDVIVRNDAMLSAMRLRAWFISQMGSRGGDFVLDKEKVRRWIHDGLDITPQAAREEMSRIRTVMGRTKGTNGLRVLEPGSEIEGAVSHLRRIKNRLRVAQMLIDCGEIAAEPELHEWLEVFEELP